MRIESVTGAFGRLLRDVHGVARRGRAEVREPGAGDQEVRRIGMIDRRQHAAGLEQRGRIGLAAFAGRAHDLRDAGLRRGSRRWRFVDRRVASDEPRATAIGRDDLAALGRLHLHQTHENITSMCGD